MKRRDRNAQLTKDRECVSCKRAFNCKGKPPWVTACLCYEKRLTDGKNEPGKGQAL